MIIPYLNIHFPGRLIHTVGNVRKFIKFVCYEGNVKFDDIYGVFE